MEKDYSLEALKLIERIDCPIGEVEALLRAAFGCPGWEKYLSRARDCALGVQFSGVASGLRLTIRGLLYKAIDAAEQRLRPSEAPKILDFENDDELDQIRYEHAWEHIIRYARALLEVYQAAEDYLWRREVDPGFRPSWECEPSLEMVVGHVAAACHRQ